MVSTLGCPTTRPSVTSPIPSRASSPAPGGKDFLQAYNCQAVVDSAHQVIVAARATNQTSDKQQAAAMMEETIDNVGAVPQGKYPPMLAITRQRQSTSSMLWAWTRSSRRSRPATAGLCHPRPEVAYPAICLPGDRMRRKLETRRGRQRYALRMQTVEPVLGQIKQGRGFRQFLLSGSDEGERRMVADLHRPQPAQTVPLWGQSAQDKHGSMGQPNASGTLPR